MTENFERDIDILVHSESLTAIFHLRRLPRLQEQFQCEENFDKPKSSQACLDKYRTQYKWLTKCQKGSFLHSAQCVQNI